MSKTKQQEKPKAVPIGVRVDPDIARFIRLNRVETGETVTGLINRVLRREMLAARKQEPAA